MLFGQRASSGGIQYTEGLAGHIMANGQAQTSHDDTQLSYTEGQAYLKTVAASKLTYDVVRDVSPDTYTHHIPHAVNSDFFYKYKTLLIHREYLLSRHQKL